MALFFFNWWESFKVFVQKRLEKREKIENTGSCKTFQKKTFRHDFLVAVLKKFVFFEKTFYFSFGGRAERSGTEAKPEWSGALPPKKQKKVFFKKKKKFQNSPQKVVPKFFFLNFARSLVFLVFFCKNRFRLIFSKIGEFCETCANALKIAGFDCPLCKAAEGDSLSNSFIGLWLDFESKHFFNSCI